MEKTLEVVRGGFTGFGNMVPRGAAGNGIYAKEGEPDCHVVAALLLAMTWFRIKGLFGKRITFEDASKSGKRKGAFGGADGRNPLPFLQNYFTGKSKKVSG